MSRKTKYKSAPLNILVSLICISIAAGSIYFFWKDVNKTTVRKDGKQIATITFKYKIAQRKFNDRVVWERLQNNSPLYNGDTVRTADLAQASIHFFNDIDIDVSENTMLQIFLNEDGKLNVSVDDGNVELDTSAANSGIMVEMKGGVKVDVESGSKMLASSTTSGNNGTIQVISGKASVKNEAGNVQPVKKGESVKVEEGGKISKKPVTVTSIPAVHKIIQFEEKKPSQVQLEWSVPEEKEEETVIIKTSKTKDFESVDKVLTVKKITSAVIPAEHGVTYWRVYTQEDENSFAEGKITVDNVEKVQALAPQNGEKFMYRGVRPSVNFAWNGNDFVSKYKLEVAKDSSFKNVVLKEEIESKSYSLSGLEDGDYYWRISPYYSLNNAGYVGETESRRFSVIKRKEYERPQQIVPVENGKFIYDGSDFNASFVWKSEISNGSYKVVFAKDASFQKVVKEMECSNKRLDTRLDVSQFPAGEYYWKIVQSFADETDGGTRKTLESAGQKFIVEKFVPEKSRLIYPLNGFAVESDGLASVEFMWKLASPELKNTVFQVSKDKDFKNLELEKSVEAQSLSNLNLNQGLYYWRIKTDRQRENGLFVSEYTNPNKITVLGKLGAPVILSPKNGAFKLLPTGEEVEVRWESVPQAEYYKLSFTDDKGKIIKETTCSDSNRVFLNPGELSKINGQKFKVKLQAFANETPVSPLRIGSVSESDFELRAPSPVRLDEVSDGKRIAGLNAIREETVFTWKDGLDVASEYEFLLWKKTAGGVPKLIERQKTSRKQVRLSRLTEGSYQWTVKARNGEGIVLDAEKAFDFYVNSIPMLEKPVLTEPAENFKIGPSYLKRNRSVQFEWNAVPGATDYNFVLYQKQSDGKLRKVYSENRTKNNSVKIRNLAVLDVGNFEWHVTGYSHAKDGYEEQKGKEAIGYFNIDFSAPVEIKTQNPGIMYGE